MPVNNINIQLWTVRQEISKDLPGTFQNLVDFVIKHAKEQAKDK
jgi:hypothetical protein